MATLDYFPKVRRGVHNVGFPIVENKISNDYCFHDFVDDKDTFDKYYIDD